MCIKCGMLVNCVYEAKDKLIVRLAIRYLISNLDDDGLFEKLLDINDDDNMDVEKNLCRLHMSLQ